MKYLIVGLGNIGSEYTETRHNIGFKVVEAFAKLAGVSFRTLRYGDVAEAKWKGRTYILLKPSTYMNLSGNALNYWMQAEKIILDNVLVIVDDVALPLGSIRVRSKGSDGGHNGLKNIALVLGNTNYARLRFGIGNDYPPGHQIDFVLGQWTKDEQNILPSRIDVAVEAVKSFGTIGLERTMNFYNGK